MNPASNVRMKPTRHFAVLLVFAFFLGMSTSKPASAADVIPAKPLLVVTGKIANKNDGERFVLDMAMLKALPQHSFRTRTPWYGEARQYSGPLLRDVLAAAKAQGKMLTAHALNDYKVSIPVGDAMNYEVIVARLMDGKPMPVRDKGPLFIIYPFDEKNELRAQTYYGRSVWQLREIHVD